MGDVNGFMKYARKDFEKKPLREYTKFIKG